MQVTTKIRVRGVKYPAGHYLYPSHDAQPGGPLVPFPGSVVALSAGGDGGRAAGSSQRYIGWACVRGDEPTLADGEPIMMTDRVPSAAGTIRIEHAAVRYRWVYDPTPVVIEQTPEILRAIARGEIQKVEAEPAPKRGRGGE